MTENYQMNTKNDQENGQIWLLFEVSQKLTQCSTEIITARTRIQMSVNKNECECDDLNEWVSSPQQKCMSLMCPSVVFYCNYVQKRWTVFSFLPFDFFSTQGNISGPTHEGIWSILSSGYYMILNIKQGNKCLVMNVIRYQYAYRRQKLTLLHLFTDLFHKEIFLTLQNKRKVGKSFNITTW